MTAGSIVEPVDATVFGRSTFHGNLTVESGDLNLVSGTLKLSNMKFGQVPLTKAAPLLPVPPAQEPAMVCVAQQKAAGECAGDGMCC
eukprot:SAG11_NODE_24016_length_379_cov_0.903571_1_plen_86_part_01